MKKLLDFANQYAKRSTWKEFALVKFCLFAVGVMVGLFLPQSIKIPALIIAALVFLVTYIPLMIGFFKGGRKSKGFSEAEEKE